jgi:hypothetical protein
LLYYPNASDHKASGKELHGIKPENLYRKEVNQANQKPSISHQMAFLKVDKRMVKKYLCVNGQADDIG